MWRGAQANGSYAACTEGARSVVWRNVRIALWAHSLASWAAFGVLWLDTLRQPNRAPIDGQFWLVFLLTEGLAPLWLPLSLIIYQPVAGYNAALRSEERRVGKECRSRWAAEH